MKNKKTGEAVQSELCETPKVKKTWSNPDFFVIDTDYIHGSKNDHLRVHEHTGQYYSGKNIHNVPFKGFRNIAHTSDIAITYNNNRIGNASTAAS